MVHPLRRGWNVLAGRFPQIVGVLSDSLAVLIAVAGLVAGGASSRGADRPDSVVLDFTASWCQPCQRMSPIVHKLQQQGYAIQKVDVDQQPKLAKSYGIASIPTFVLVINGEEVTRITGPTSEEQLRRMAMQAVKEGQPKSNPRANPRANPPRQSILLAESSRSSGDGAATNPSHNIQLTASEESVGTSKDRRQPQPADTKRGLMGSLFSKNRAKPRGDRPDADVPLTVRGLDPVSDEELPPASQPLAASARLRVSDETGSNFGSGTIIDSRTGRTTILTCGHIFRSQQPKKDDGTNDMRVEVDIFFPGGKHQTYIGQLVEFDLEGDVGVVTIETAGQLPFTPVAPLSELPVTNDELVSIGCGGGEQPSAESIRVTAINRYIGPENIECTGVPIQGRSGGGLFDAHGQLVGVCIAADQEGRRGLYAGLKPIYELLSKAGMKQLAPPTPRQNLEPEFDSMPADIAAAPRTNPPAAAEDVDAFLNRAFNDPNAEPMIRGASPEEIDQLFQQSPDAEVICIVRPKNGDAGRVVILNQASTKFVSYLLDSLDGPRNTTPRAASLRVEDEPNPLGDAWVPDEDLGVPKKAPDFAQERRTKPLHAAAGRRPANRSRFGSRSEN